MDVVRTQRTIARRTTARSVSIQTETMEATPSSVNESTINGHESTMSTATTSTAPENSSPLQTPDSGGYNDRPPPPRPVAPRRNRPGPFQRLRVSRRFRRAFSEPPLRTPRRRLLEDHYRVDADRRLVLPGVPQYEADWARDCHDFFNLVVLVPVVVLNVMNWNWDHLMYHGLVQYDHPRYNFLRTLREAWTGDWFNVFFQVTALYFVVDLLWVLIVPSCVRSPSTIVKHHLATMLYILIPYYHPEFRWCMGACMSVEVNTWFLIARRVLNKQGFPPWTIDLSFVSIRVKLISICFYITWISVRCILYPALMGPFYQNWMLYSRKVGTPWNVVALCVPLHAAFCLLNLKWSYDLLMSKIRYWRRQGSMNGKDQISKGL